MSYEYNATAQRFEVANPYRIENAALIVCGGIAIVIGFLLFLSSRSDFGQDNWRAGREFVVALTLMVAGIGAVAWVLTQLRFFFGRGLPVGLATELQSVQSNPDLHAIRYSSEELKNTLRHNNLSYAEPKGPIAGLVHWLLRDLIYAPEPVRRAAEAQCENALFTAALLLSYVVTLLAYDERAPKVWTAIAFAVALAPRLLKPLRRHASQASQSGISLRSILLIILIPMFLPMVMGSIASKLPDLSGTAVIGGTLIALCTLLAAQVVFCLALKRQIGPPLDANSAYDQRTLSMNSSPTKLFEELERELQRRWSEGIPNRRYGLVPLPTVYSGQSNSFAGEVVEETQPLPQHEQTESLFSSIQDPRRRSLVILTTLAALAFIASVITSVMLTRLSAVDASIASYIFVAAAFLLTATYCFHSAHFLWGRFEFASQLLWIELKGSVEEAHVGMGSQFRDMLQTEKKVVNVEGMTITVWVADLVTVSFGKDAQRRIVAMRGRKDVASYFADHLVNYASSLSSVVMPSSAGDKQRIAMLATTNAQIGAALGQSGVDTMLRDLPKDMPVPPPMDRRMCRNTACGQLMPVNALFCSSCGTPLN